MKVNISSIHPNPHRDFHTYPYDEAQLDRLNASIGELGNFRSIAARPHPTLLGHYQIAEGHHRIKVMRDLGITEVELSVEDYSEDQMIEIMTVENAAQRGHNAAALLDSVAAITRRLAYLLMFSGSYEHFRTIVQKPLIDCEESFKKVIGRLMAGEGIGRDLICGYAPTGSLTEKEARTAIATLKADGSLGKIVKETEERLREEFAAEEEARRLADEEADRAAEEAQRDADEADAKAAEAKRKSDLSAQRKADTEARKAAAHRDEEDKKKAHRQKLRWEEKVKNDSRLSNARAASRHQPEQELGDDIAAYFTNNTQLESFRRAVTTDDAKKYLPVSQHAAIAKWVMTRKVAPSGREIEALIGDKIKAVIQNLNRKSAAERKREQQAVDRRSKVRQLELATDTLMNGLARASAGMTQIVSLLKEYPNLGDDLDSTRLLEVVSRLDENIRTMQHAKAVFHGFDSTRRSVY